MYVIYGKKGCANCEKAKNLLSSKGLEYQYLVLDEDYTREELISVCPFPPRELPQIFKSIDGVEKYIGAWSDLQKSL